MSDDTTYEVVVDRNALFDMIAKVGDGGVSLGTRLAGVLLGGSTAIDDIGLAVYGVHVRQSLTKGENA